MRRTPLKRRSLKRDRFQRELDAITPALMERAEYRCEVGIMDCSGAFHRHHKLMRSHGGTNELSNLVWCCDRCHSFVHRHPEWSYARGWLIRGVA